MIKCPECGTESPADTKFCPECGTRLGAAAVVQREVRRTVTVLFSDVTSSTALGERFGIEPLPKGGGARHVREEDGDRPPYLALHDRGRSQPRPTFGAELRVGRALRAALGALDHGPRSVRLGH